MLCSQIHCYESEKEAEAITLWKGLSTRQFFGRQHHFLLRIPTILCTLREFKTIATDAAVETSRTDQLFGEELLRHIVKQQYYIAISLKARQQRDRQFPENSTVIVYSDCVLSKEDETAEDSCESDGGGGFTPNKNW